MIGYEIAINDQSPVVVTSPDVASRHGAIAIAFSVIVFM